MNRKIEFTKVRDVKTPNRANSHDAGTDFYVPEFNTEFLIDMLKKNADNCITYKCSDEGMDFIIPAGEQILIPSGIKVNILDKSTYLEAQNKSGVASKYGLLVGACVIDADYQGEVHINLHNVSNKEVKISTGQKIIQFIHKNYIDTEWSEISNEDYNNLGKSDRGSGGFGSTGEK